MFLQTPSRNARARANGCSVVEMETAVLYAIAENKQVEALSLVVVSDCATEKGWNPSLKSARTEALNDLADAVLAFASTD